MNEPEAQILIIGAGLGATQVLDILASGRDAPWLLKPTDLAIGLLDDDRELWDTEQHGLPVLGGSDKLPKLAKAHRDPMKPLFAVIAISTSIKARMELSDKCIEAGVPLASVRHKTAYIAHTARMGFGNVICAYCHVGAHAKLGHNNFISAYNSLDHHNTLGSHCSMGPANATSGIVEIGDRVRMGTGIQVEPNWKIGDDAFIASGCLIRQDVPPNTKVMQTGAKLIITKRSDS